MFPNMIDYFSHHSEDMAFLISRVIEMHNAYLNDSLINVNDMPKKLLVFAKHIYALLLEKFDENRIETFLFLRKCMHLVSLLLYFTRAERQGNVKLHLAAFSKMLPWLTIFDHINYMCWDSKLTKPKSSL